MEAVNEVVAIPEKVRTWNRAFLIPQYLIQSIGDSGMWENYTEDKKFIDSDDLRIHIELSGGVRVVLDGHTRMVCEPAGIWIEFLSEPHE